MYVLCMYYGCYISQDSQSISRHSINTESDHHSVTQSVHCGLLLFISLHSWLTTFVVVVGICWHRLNLHSTVTVLLLWH
jgi:hypothetical protein